VSAAQPVRGLSLFRRVKVITSAVSLVPSEKLDQDTARAIAAVAPGATGELRIKMH
jgi:hypothetical protein